MDGETVKLVTLNPLASLESETVMASSAEIMGEGTAFQKLMRFTNAMLLNGNFELAAILCEKLLSLDADSEAERPANEKMTRAERTLFRVAFAGALRKTHKWKRALEEYPTDEELELIKKNGKDEFVSLLIGKAECHLELLLALSRSLAGQFSKGASEAEMEAIFMGSSSRPELEDHSIKCRELTVKAFKMCEPGSSMQGSTLLMHGRLLEALEDYEGAKNVMERAMSCMSRDNPDADVTAHRLGYLYLRLGQAKRAVDLATEKFNYICAMCEQDDLKFQIPLVRQSFSDWLMLLGNAHVYLKNVEYGMLLRERAQMILQRASSFSRDDMRKEATLIFNHSATERICSFCKKISEKQVIKKCSGCRQKHYCGAECQLNDWPNHRAECGVKRNN